MCYVVSRRHTLVQRDQSILFDLFFMPMYVEEMVPFGIRMIMMVVVVCIVHMVVVVVIHVWIHIIMLMLMLVVMIMIMVVVVMMMVVPVLVSVLQLPVPHDQLGQQEPDRDPSDEANSELFVTQEDPSHLHTVGVDVREVWQGR
ncbi:hypothetical protein EUX98_g2964 [Antrodiella citrinella]|uniref:Uncharacterized protein n=1 Tax=Antrodiella citrinella TaxID=2447956 RepID=A0A4S4N5Y9_9APHY|nr:hypothetical protein EUX98_g2964 [Antrodiella citrinella]